MTVRWDAPDKDTLRRALNESSRPYGPMRTTFFRDVYYDTGNGDLRQRGVRCRVRFAPNGEQLLRVSSRDGSRVETRLRQSDTARALAGDSPAARALRAHTDPARLTAWLEREVERTSRTFRAPVLPLPFGDLITEIITARRGDLTACMYQIALRPRPWGRLAARRLAAELDLALPLRSANADAVAGMQAALELVEGASIARELRGEREIALVAVEHGRIGLRRAGTELRLPIGQGSGEEACRIALRDLVGGGEGQLRRGGSIATRHPERSSGSRRPSWSRASARRFSAIRRP